MRDEAVEHDLAALQSGLPELRAAEARSVYKSRGWTAYWRARTEALASSGSLGCGSYEMARGYLRWGDRDKAFAALNTIVDGRCFDVVLLKTDPELDPIREDKRFASLLQRVNLAER